ncbi:AzlD domain-containing protein [Dubosiella newyorkensis]|uniref:AzlD domain-containing protein n=1 Tax=Dubosiella newyorkensis TaxID=1862672 RepID=UPI0023F275E9|nr:AzlD domain-containing protein [Dubosiella newyorkensis]
MKMAILIGLLSLATYLPRLLPALLIDSIHFSKRWRTFLRLLPYTVMAALIVPGTLSGDGESFAGSLAGTFVAILGGWFSLPPIFVVLLAVLSA